MAGNKQLLVSVIGDVKPLQEALKKATGATTEFSDKAGGGLGGVGKALGGLVAGFGAASFLKDSIQQATESAQAQSKLELALKNSTATVGVNASEFAKLNTELAKHTLADDDVIAATEAQMVTFGASKEQIKSLIPTVLDYAAKMGVTAPEAADLFDKASLGSAKALKTLGIEGYKPTGDKANDLANIQAMLAGKVKGAAQAQLDAAGPGAKIKKSMDELQESIGTLLLPVLTKLASALSGLIDWFTNLSTPIKVAIGVVGGLAIAVWAINTASAVWATVTSAVAGAFWVLNAAMDANPVVLVTVAIVAVGAALYEAYQHVGWFRDIVDNVFGWIGGFVSGALDVVKGAFTGVKNWVGDRIGDIVGFVTGIPGRIAGAASTMWDGVKNAFTATKNWVGDRVGDVVAFFTTLPNRIGGVLGGLKDLISAPFKMAFNAVTGLWNNSIGSLSFSVPSWVPGLGGKGFSMPKLPTLAAGGPINGLALVGEKGPELFAGRGTIIPNGRLGGMAGGAPAGPVINITVNGALDPRAVAKQIDQIMTSYNRGGRAAFLAA